MQEYRIFKTIFGEDVRKFPGTLPVSLNCTMIPKLLTGYAMAPKADGERAYLFMGCNKEHQIKSAWFFFRSEKIETILTCDDVSGEPLTLSLLDVEVRAKEKRIDVFDLLMVEDEIVASWCISMRMEAMRKCIFQLSSVTTPVSKSTSVSAQTDQLATQNATTNLSQNPQDVELALLEKELELLKQEMLALEQDSTSDGTKNSTIENKVLLLPTSKSSNNKTWSDTYEKWAPYIYPTRYKGDPEVLCGGWKIHVKPYFPPHVLKDIYDLFPDCDGWIFNRLLESYPPHRLSNETCLKWKPREKMTLDFALEQRALVDTDGDKDTMILDTIYKVDKCFTTETKGEYILSVNSHKGRRLRFGFANLPPHFRVTHPIAEFAWVNGSWKFIQLRPDKSEPNSVETVVGTIHDMEGSPTIRDLSMRLFNIHNGTPCPRGPPKSLPPTRNAKYKHGVPNPVSSKTPFIHPDRKHRFSDPSSNIERNSTSSNIERNCTSSCPPSKRAAR